jgi:hypothetical protein
MRIRFSPSKPPQREDIERVTRVERAMFDIDRCFRPTSQIIDRLYRRWCGLEEVEDCRRTRTPDSFRYGFLALLAMFKVNDQMEFKHGTFCSAMRKIETGEFAKLVQRIGGVRWTMGMQKLFLKTLVNAKVIQKTNPYRPKSCITELWIGLDAQKVLEEIKAVWKKAVKKMPVLCRVNEDPLAKCRRAVKRSNDSIKSIPSVRRPAPSVEGKKSTPSASLPGVESLYLQEEGTAQGLETLVPGDLVPVIQKLRAVFPDDPITEVHVGHLKRWWNHREEKVRLTVERLEAWLLAKDAEVDDAAIQCSLDQFCKRWSWVWRSIVNWRLLYREDVDLGTVDTKEPKRCMGVLRDWSVDFFDHVDALGGNVWERLITPDFVFDREPLNFLARFIVVVNAQQSLHWLHTFVEPASEFVRQEPHYFVALENGGYPIREWLQFNDQEAKELRCQALLNYGTYLRNQSLVAAWAS